MLERLELRGGVSYSRAYPWDRPSFLRPWWRPLFFFVRGLLEFLDGLAETFGETGKFGSAEQHEQDDQNDHQLGRPETEDTRENGERSFHGDKLVCWHGL